MIEDEIENAVAETGVLNFVFFHRIVEGRFLSDAAIAGCWLVLLQFRVLEREGAEDDERDRRYGHHGKNGGVAADGGVRPYAFLVEDIARNAKNVQIFHDKGMGKRTLEEFPNLLPREETYDPTQRMEYGFQRIVILQSIKSG